MPGRSRVMMNALFGFHQGFQPQKPGGANPVARVDLTDDSLSGKVTHEGMLPLRIDVALRKQHGPD